jgi:hypothetical protein
MILRDMKTLVLHAMAKIDAELDALHPHLRHLQRLYRYHSRLAARMVAAGNGETAAATHRLALTDTVMLDSAARASLSESWAKFSASSTLSNVLPGGQLAVVCSDICG